jgi:hypothetical protein
LIEDSGQILIWLLDGLVFAWTQIEQELSKKDQKNDKNAREIRRKVMSFPATVDDSGG